MNKVLTTLALTAITLTGVSPSYALNINTMEIGGAENLAQSFVGSGITISNVKYTGKNTATGYFTNGIEAGIGIDKGIVLTSGSAASLGGNTNNADDTTTIV